MIYPAIGSLIEKTGNRFTLVIVVAKRAKQLSNGAHKLTRYDSKNPITLATNEVDENMITYSRAKSTTAKGYIK